MKLNVYNANRVRKSIAENKPQPELIDVIEMVMESNKVMKREEIIDAVHLKTDIDKADLNGAIDSLLKTLERDKKISHVKTGYWQKN